jgi:hypothetical protein
MDQPPMKKRDYAAFAYRIISKALNLIPTDMSVENRSSNWMIMVKATIDFKKLVLSDKELKTYKCPNQYFCPTLKISGFADPANK